MRSTILAFAAGFVLVICGCASVDVAPPAARAATAAQLSINSSSIKLQEPVRFTITAPGSRCADFQMGLYTQTQTALVLFAYDDRDKSFNKVFDVPIRAIQSVALASWGLLNNLKQLQVSARGKVIAVDFNNSTQAEAGAMAKTKPALDMLLAAGVKRTAFQSPVWPNQSCHATIPILLPAR